MKTPQSTCIFTPLDHMPSGVIIIRRDYTIIFWNQTMEGWTGQSNESVLGKKLTDMYPHLGQGKYHDRIDTVFCGAPAVIFSSLLHRYLIPIERADGQFRIQQSTVSSLEDENGERIAIISIQDVTELNTRIVDYRAMRDKAYHEIEERRRAEEQLRLAAAVFDNTTEGIMVTDKNGIIESVNRAFTITTGYSPAEAIGQTPALLSSGRHGAVFYKAMWSALKKDGAWFGEIWDKRKNGEIYPIEITINAIINSQEELTHYAAIFSDITERKEVEEALLALSVSDGLTGLANRRAFDNSIKREWRRALRRKTPLSLIMVDIDYFKPYNDHYGHQMGDTSLRQVGAALTKCVHRPGDLVTRYGGEEFAVILPQTDLENAKAIAERIRESMAELGMEHAKSKVADHVTISAGVACIVPRRDGTPDLLIEQADMALYQAKGEGRNRVAVYNDSTARS